MEGRKASPRRFSEGWSAKEDNPDRKTSVLQDKKHCYEIQGSKNRTDLPRTTLQRIKGLESWFTECVIVRRAGRLKLRWEGGIDQDRSILEVKNWKKFALDRDEWAKLLKKARAHQGLSSR